MHAFMYAHICMHVHAYALDFRWPPQCCLKRFVVSLIATSFSWPHRSGFQNPRVQLLFSIVFLGVARVKILGAFSHPNVLNEHSTFTLGHKTCIVGFAPSPRWAMCMHDHLVGDVPQELEDFLRILLALACRAGFWPFQET